MATRKVALVLAASVFVFFSVAYRAIAQETTTTTTKTTTTTTTEKDKKSDKAKKAEGQPPDHQADQPPAHQADQPPAHKADEAPGHKADGDKDKGKGHEGEAKEKEKDKCAAPKLTTQEKKTGYTCVAAKTCDKECNLWRSDKETNAAEFVAKQDVWTEATDGQRRRYRYYCTCEAAK